MSENTNQAIDISLTPEMLAKYLRWEVPTKSDIKQALATEHKYPIEAFPTLIQDAILEAVATIKCPLALAANSALGCLSAASQGLFDVARDRTQISPVSLALVTIGESGERKTAVDNAFNSSIIEWQSKQNHTLKENLRLFDLQKKDNPEIKKPSHKKLLFSKGTSAQLIANLGQYPCTFIHSNEAATVLSGQATKSENFIETLGVWNRGWDGQMLTNDTKMSGYESVANPRVTTCLMLQESVYQHFANTNGGMASSTGLLARWLISRPESTIGGRWYTEPSNIDIKDLKLTKYHNLLTGLLNSPLEFDDYGTLKPRVLTLENDAKSCWVEFHDHVERSIASGEELNSITSWGAKAAEQLARLAALFQIVETNTKSTVVKKHNIENAIKLVVYYMSEVLKLNNSSKNLVNEKVLRWLIAYCKKNNTNHIVKYTVQQKIHNDLRKNKEQLNDAFIALAEHGYIQETETENKLFIFVNPNLLVD